MMENGEDIGVGRRKHDMEGTGERGKEMRKRKGEVASACNFLTYSRWSNPGYGPVSSQYGHFGLAQVSLVCSGWSVYLLLCFSVRIVNKTASNTNVVLPLPVGPMMAFIPMENIPLQSNTHTNTD